MYATNAKDQKKPAAFDAADYLDSPEMIATYLTRAFESEDPPLIAKAIGAVARAQGMTDSAERPACHVKICIARWAATLNPNSRRS